MVWVLLFILKDIKNSLERCFIFALSTRDNVINMYKNLRIPLFIALIIIASLQFSIGQDGEITASAKLASPYESLNTYFNNLKVRNYHPEVAASIVSPSIESLEERIDIVVKLKEILNKKDLRPNMSQVPRYTEYKDTITDQYVFTPFAKVLPEVYLERVGTSWYLSEESSELIPVLHRERFPVGVEFLKNIFPQAGQRSFLGIKLWQFVGFAILLTLGYFMKLLLTILIKILIRWLVNEEKVRYYPVKIESRRVASNLSLIMVFWLFYLFVPSLELPVYWSGFVTKGYYVAILIFISATVLRVIEFIAHIFSIKASKTETKMDDQAIPIVKSILKAFIIVFTILYILKLLEVNVTALIAGVSIGGLALALAAQETVKNFIGSMVVFIDRPFQIGDYVEIEGITGIIAEVGLRSTKIRAKDNSVISVPNGKLLSANIKNMGVDEVRMMETKIDLKPTTSVESAELFVEGLKDIVREHPKALIKESLIHIFNFQSSAVTVRFRTYLKVKSHMEELAVKEDIFKRIMGLVEDLKIELK